MSNYHQEIKSAVTAISILENRAFTSNELLSEAKLLIRQVVDGKDLDANAEESIGTLRRCLNYLRLRIEALQTGEPWTDILKRESDGEAEKGAN